MAGDNVLRGIIVYLNLYDKGDTVRQPQEEGKGRGKEVQCQDLRGRVIADICNRNSMA